MTLNIEYKYDINQGGTIMSEENNLFTCNCCGKIFNINQDSSACQPAEKAGVRCPLCGSQYVSQSYSTNKGYTCHPCG